MNIVYVKQAVHGNCQSQNTGILASREVIASIIKNTAGSKDDCGNMIVKIRMLR